ncbi:MAG TPA: hypothetical protein VG917_04715 [Patescibacteria group bacterium]|nr:hypothetical protein [Patescibacteria group bacterium]
MKINIPYFVRGVVIGVLVVYLVYSFINPSLITKPWDFISDETIALFISAFLGGFSAGLFGYYFNSKSRVKELRHTKYFEHRNTIVQIEHELIGVREDLSRDLESMKLALEVRNDRYRFILRFFDLNISSGLSLRLLDLDLINKYSQLYIALQSINSDIKYLQSIVTQLQDKIDIDNPNITPAIMSLMNMYETMLEHTFNQLLIADRMSLELVAICRVALEDDTETTLEKYENRGGEIKYSITKTQIDKEIMSISQEENRPGSKEDPKPRFVSLYFDIYRIVVGNPI